jgi:hypothetical protein
MASYPDIFIGGAHKTGLMGSYSLRREKRDVFSAHNEASSIETRQWMSIEIGHKVFKRVIRWHELERGPKQPAQWRVLAAGLIEQQAIPRMRIREMLDSRPNIGALGETLRLHASPMRDSLAIGHNGIGLEFDLVCKKRAGQRYACFIVGDEKRATSRLADFHQYQHHMFINACNST